jgi:hypothetical protein
VKKSQVFDTSPEVVFPVSFQAMVLSPLWVGFSFCSFFMSSKGLKALAAHTSRGFVIRVNKWCNGGETAFPLGLLVKCLPVAPPSMIWDLWGKKTASGEG